MGLLYDDELPLGPRPLCYIFAHIVVFGRPLQVTVRPMLQDRCPVCNVGDCGQTVGCIKMPLGAEVGLDPGHIVFDWDPAPPPLRKGHSSPILFGPYLLWPNG